MTFRSMNAITAAALLVAGCGKKTSPAPTTAESTQTPAPTEDSPAAKSQEPPAPAYRASASAPAPAAPVAIAPAPVDMSATLGRLTEALRRFSVEHRRVPTSLGEVVAAGYVNGMPQAPYGKKFAIDAKQVQVVLANQ